MKTFQASICLGLLLCSSACDEGSEGPDELALEREAELETMLEINHGVELERVDRLSDSDPANDELAFDLDAEAISWTEVDDLAPPPAEGLCGPGHWEYDSRSPGCNSCKDEGWPAGQQWGKKYEHYKRWCWDGPPYCGGCEGWQYTGWSCLQGCW